MKKYYLILITIFFLQTNYAQVIFSNSAGNLTLQSFSSGSALTQYTTIPTPFTTIEDGRNNNVGSAFNPNKPFNVSSLKNKGWAIAYNAQDNDTFFVSTSWFDTITIAANRWLVTPQISTITPNTVLTWFAKSPDPSNADAYEVYGTTKTGTLTSTDFTLGDRLFTIASYSTASGGENSTWTRRSINITPFAGQSLRFAFKNYSTNKYQLWIDDIQVVTTTYSLDLGLSNLKTDKYVLTNSLKTIGLSYTNNGAMAINAITLNYKIGTSSTQTQTIALTNPLSYRETNAFTFSLPYSISTAGLYPVKCWISIVNGQTDQTKANDTLRANITIQSISPNKNVLVEQYVGAYDGESCEAQNKLLALKNDSTIIAVNVHDADSLESITAVGLINSYKKEFATSLINRTFDDSLASISLTYPYYKNRITKQFTTITPASVSIINKIYNSSSNTLTFTVKADFVGEVKGDYRLNAYLTENNVSGNNSDTTVNGFNQINNYFNAPWSPYYNLGYFSSSFNNYVLKPWQYKHQNTLIHSFDNSFGIIGAIPTTGGTQGQSYQKTYTLTLPTVITGVSKYIADNIYIIGFVAEYNINKFARAILNVSQKKLTANPEIINVRENNITNFNFKIYPNPSTGLVYLETQNQLSNYEIKIIDVLGKCVFIQNDYNTIVPKSIDLSGLNNGVYFLSIRSKNKIVSEKIIIQK